MGRYDGYLLCTDFDGTFALPGAALSQENLDAVHYFQSEGGLFTIASGRTPEFIRDLTGPFEVNAPVIAMNGTMVLDEHDFSIIRDYPMSEECLEVLDGIAGLGLCEQLTLWNAEDERNRWTKDGGDLPSAHYARHPRPWYKAVMVCSDEPSALAMRAWFNERWTHRFAGSRSWPTGFEVQDAHAGKGEAMKWIREYLGEKVRLTVGAGDFENDISLIRAADIGYAVGNAIPEVKAAADRVTVPNTGHAIAAIIEELGRQYISGY